MERSISVYFWEPESILFLTDYANLGHVSSREVAINLAVVLFLITQTVDQPLLTLAWHCISDFWDTGNGTCKILEGNSDFLHSPTLWMLVLYAVVLLGYVAWRYVMNRRLRKRIQHKGMTSAQARRRCLYNFGSVFWLDTPSWHLKGSWIKLRLSLNLILILSLSADIILLYLTHAHCFSASSILEWHHVEDSTCTIIRWIHYSLIGLATTLFLVSSILLCHTYILFVKSVSTKHL